MATEGDRQNVLRTTKVRTALKGDSSWIQRRREPDEEEEEKPWIAEVRASRLNGAPDDGEPETAPTKPEPEPKASTDSPKTPASGYLIRGVFTKTDTKPTTPSSTNGYIGTSGFTKRPSEGYKKIAPHTVRSNVESAAIETDPTISKEELDRRTETASNVLRSSAARQRSYVLSAAKKYESPSEKPNSSDPPVISFVAKRVVISDEEDSDPAEPISPTSPSPQAQPAPNPKESVEMSVEVPAPPLAPVRKKEPSVTPEPKPRIKAEPAPTQSNDTLDSLADTLMLVSSTPEPTSVSKPVAAVTPAAPETKKLPSTALEPKTEPTPKASSVTEPVTPAAASTAPDPKPKAEPTPKPRVTEPVAPQKVPPMTPEPQPKAEPTPKPSVSVPVSAPQKAPTTTPEPTPKPSVTEPIAQVTPVAPVAAEKKPPAATPEAKPVATPKPSVTEPVPAAPVAQKAPSTTPTPKTEPIPKPSVTEPVPAAPAAPAATSTTETKPKNEPSPKPSVTEPVPATLAAQKAPSTTPKPESKTEPTPKPRVDPVPVQKTNGLSDDDLLGLTQSSPQKSVNPVPTTTDLLTGADSSLPKSEKTQKSLDLLAVDVIPIDTNTDKLSTDKTTTTKTETTKTVVQSKDPKSLTETVTTTTTKTEIITNNSSRPQSEKTLDLLAFDVIPIDTKNEKLSTNITPSKVETSSKKEPVSSADPFDPIPIVSECTKSPVELFDPLLLDSSTDPSGLSNEEELLSPLSDDDTSKEPFDSSVPGTNQRSSDNGFPSARWTSHLIDTPTEKRETKADPKPMETSYTSSTRWEDSSAEEPKDNDSKKGIVYVKEYVNLPELSTYGDSDMDYLTSTSSSYAYSSPSSTSMTACTYCGRPVGNDAKITIEHLNISCHPECFKCGICSKPMGDFLSSMFLHRGTVHCESCYANVL